MYIAHNTQIPKYSMVDTACSKTGSRHHVHCTQYTDTKYSMVDTACSKTASRHHVRTLHTIHRYKNTSWWIQPAQRRALDTMYIAHNTQMVDTACSKTGSRHHVHSTQYTDTKIQHGGYSLLKDRLSTPCTLHTIHRYKNTAWWIQPAQRLSHPLKNSLKWDNMADTVHSYMDSHIH